MWCQCYLHAGTHFDLELERREGMNGADVLLRADKEVPSAIGVSSRRKADVGRKFWDQVAYFLVPQKKTPKPLVAEDVVNVFTIASGLMYERLQKIMILSVIRNTRARFVFLSVENIVWCA